jgi:ribosomal protein S18 acetylase RimI-like enzyme/predicted nucleic acid-binding protein
MNIKITQIDHNSRYLKDVIALGDANKNTLGLFPKDAYEESASKKQIIIAVDSISGNLIGYLLFNLSRRKMLVSIVHLCVAAEWRSKGIPQHLFDELKRITQDGYLSVRVRCRVDYPANRLWPKLGFVAMGEMKGRGKKETRLNIWKYEFAHQSLFSYAALQNENVRTKVVIDANVFYQLQFPEIPEHEESLPLFEPWLDIDLFITPELLNEINRNPDSIKKEAARKFSDSFEMVDSKTSHEKYKNIQRDLRVFFPEKLKQSDESDLRQLAYAVADDIPFFVTRDGPMLGRAEPIFEKFGIQILRPSDLILLQDELLRGDDYAPSRLAGSQIHLEKVHSQESQKIVEKFLSDQTETKNALNKKIQILLSNAASTETYMVKDASGEELGLVSYSRQTDGQVLVHLLRVGKLQICQYVAKYLVNNVVLSAGSLNKDEILVNDEHLSEKVVYALQESGFLKTSAGWVKISLRQILDIKDVENQLGDLRFAEYSKVITSALQSSPSDAVLLEVEKYLWPLKLKDINLPSFIVPIRPEWAMHLFDVDIARQDLFGSEPTLILNTENVYYRSGFQKVLSAPGRVLWYVSAGKGRYQGAMFIKACSYLDEVEIGKPKQLFSKYKKLGVYKWNDVYKEVAKGDLNKDIMAFKFSKTEVFSRPVSLSELQVMWKNDGKTFNNAVSPLAISRERFLEIYNLGMERTKR